MILKEQNNKLDVQNFPRMMSRVTVSQKASYSVRHNVHDKTTDDPCYNIFRVINNNISSFTSPNPMIENVDGMITDYKSKYDIE
jgi:hypothetical protein